MNAIQRGDEAKTTVEKVGWTPAAVGGLATSLLGAVMFLVAVLVEANSPNTFGGTEYLATLISGILAMTVGSTASAVSNNVELRRAQEELRALKKEIARTR